MWSKNCDNSQQGIQKFVYGEAKQKNYSKTKKKLYTGYIILYIYNIYIYIFVYIAEIANIIQSTPICVPLSPGYMKVKF